MLVVLPSLGVLAPVDVKSVVAAVVVLSTIPVELLVGVGSPPAPPPPAPPSAVVVDTEGVVISVDDSGPPVIPTDKAEDDVRSMMSSTG